MVRMSIFMDLLPLKLCGKEGRPQRPDMQRDHSNPASNNLPRRLKTKVPTGLILYQETFTQWFQEQYNILKANSGQRALAFLGHIVIPVTGDYKDYVPMFPATLLSLNTFFV